MKLIKQYATSLLLSFLFISIISVPALAQENDEQEGTLLPNIESQNIEIRGEFKAQFPGLERQPILGFDPTLRIYQFPKDRIPYMETGTDAVTNLTVSQFSRPAGPTFERLQYSDVHYLFARVGVGSFESPVVNFWGLLPINDGSYIGLDVDFTGSNKGHIENRPSTYRYFTGNVEFGTRLNENMDLYIFAGMQNDFNYAARFGSNQFDKIARIEFEGIHAGAKLTSFKNEITGWTLKGKIKSFTNSYKSEYFPSKIEEITFNGSFSYRWALGHPSETITATVSGRGGMYEPYNASQQQWGTYYAGVAYKRLFNYKTRLYAEGDLYYISNFAENKVLPGAKVSLSHWFGSRLKITGRVEAKPFLKTVEQLHERNRFLGTEHQLMHTYAVRANGEASIKWYRGSRLYGGITYLNATDYAYFTPEVKGNNIANARHDFYEVNYGNVTNMKIYAGITHQLAPGTFWLNAKIYLQNLRLSDKDKAIPFSENWGLNASATYRPIDWITIKGWAQYMGDRAPGPTKGLGQTNIDMELDNIFLVGAQLDVQILEGIGAYVKVINLLDQKYQYWQGYLERPLQLYGGITITL